MTTQEVGRITVPWRRFRSSGLAAFLLFLAVICSACDSRRTAAADAFRASLSEHPHRFVDGRMTLLDPYTPFRAPRRNGDRDGAVPLELRAAAARVLVELQPLTPAERRTRAMAHLILGDGEAAVGELRTTAESDAELSSDLSAALLFHAKESGTIETALDAITAADEALAADPTLAAASFNRALALEHLGLLGEASEEWRRYLRLDSGSRWREEAKAAIERLTFETEAEQWKAAEPRIRQAAAAGDDETVGLITARFPELARRHGEAVYLADWADGDESALVTARAIGNALHRLSGESLLRDAVAAIDSAGRERHRDLVEAHRLYRSGRIAFHRHDLKRASADLRAAEKAFAAAKSPMVHVASYYRGSVAHQAGEIDEAEPLLDDVAARHPERLGYRALAAQIGWERGLCRVSRGKLDEAEEIFVRSERLASELGERDLNASMQLLLAIAADYAGQSTDAWRLRVQAFANQSRRGNHYRVLIALAAAAYPLMRVEQWGRAAAVASISAAMAVRQGQFETAAAASLLACAAETELKRPSRAAAHLHAADQWIGRIKDDQIRMRIEAERALTYAITVRDRDPRTAVAELDRAIDPLRTSGETVRLPRHFLERARAYRAAGDLQAAAHDIEHGISLIEEQRLAFADLEERATFLFVTRSLFNEAIDIALLRGDTAAALDAVERGRARALLEMFRGTSLRTPLRAADLQSALSPRAALVVFAQLRDRIAVFVVRNHRIHVFEAAREGQLDRALADLATPRTGADEASRGTAASVVDLALVRPLGGLLVGAETVAVIPDPELRRTPIRLLMAASPGTTAFVEAPSATIAIEASRRRQTEPGEAPLIVGASVFEAAAVEDARPLFTVGLEADLVASAWPRSQVLKGEQATRAAFLRKAQQASMVHFAGHGIHRRGEPSQTRLLLAPAGRAPAAVSASEIAALDLSATSVVVLNACRTAAAGSLDGLSNLATAFLVAGVPTVVAAVDDVPDAEAAEFAARLHRELRQNPPEVAVRNIRREDARAGKAAATYGTFTVFGGAKALVRQ